MKRERNTVISTLHKKLEEEENEKITKIVEEIETVKDDSRRISKVVKELQRRKEKRKLLIDGEKGKTTKEKTQVEIVTRFFNLFSREEAKKIEEIQPCKMKPGGRIVLPLASPKPG